MKARSMAHERRLSRISTVTFARRAGCAAAIGAVLVLTGGSARAGLDLTPAEKDMFATIGTIAGAVSGVGAAIGAGVSALQFANLLPGSDADVLSQLQVIQKQLAAIPVTIYADSKLQSSFWVQNMLAQSQTGFQITIQNYSSTQKLLRLSSSLGATADNDTLLATNNLSPVSGDVTTESNPYFEALYLDSATNGPNTTTVGVTTTGEWKLVMPWRPQPSGGVVFDWREGLGAFAAAVEARLGTLALIASPSNAAQSILNVDARFDGDSYGDEVFGYQEDLATRLAEVDGGIHCRESIWAVGKTVGDIDYKWICTDINTGISGISEKRATLNYPTTDPNWKCTVTYDSRGMPIYGSPCYNLHWFGPQLYWGTTREVNGIQTGNLAVSDPTVVSVFRTYAPKTSAFSTILAHGREDALNDLLTELGVFGVQRVIDHAENVWQGISQPTVNTQIKNWSSKLCLDLDPKWVAAETLATGKSQMIAGYPFVLGNCSKPTDSWTSTWGWDNTTGEVVNLVELLFAGQRWCADASSSRGQTQIVTAQCNGSTTQKWTWNAGSGMFKNDGAAMARLSANGTAVGSTVVVGTTSLEQSTDAGVGWGGI
jgi:hypothetical protein